MTESLAYGKRLSDEVLEPMKIAFVAKDEIIDLLGICLVGGQNLFLLGPPGTAKSLLVHDLSARLRGQTFDYLLTRFTEPNELFGPFDIRKLREGELITNTEGMRARDVVAPRGAVLVDSVGVASSATPGHLGRSARKEKGSEGRPGQSLGSACRGARA